VAKADRTRKRVLDAAASVLSANGYAGFRLVDVATLAGLQAPTIYYHYPSRDDLVEEVMWVGIADMRDHVLAVLDAADADATPLDRLLLAVEAHLRHALEISDYTTASVRNAGQVPAKIRRRQLKEETRYGEVWRRLIDEMVRAGQLRADLDPYVARMLIFGALNWTPEWWRPRKGSLDTVVANAQSVVRFGLCPLEVHQQR
jgi:TetR/AcrR family transcriptional regulator, cholesterol catabolism regulator